MVKDYYFPKNKKTRQTFVLTKKKLQDPQDLLQKSANHDHTKPTCVLACTNATERGFRFVNQLYNCPLKT